MKVFITSFRGLLFICAFLCSPSQLLTTILATDTNQKLQVVQSAAAHLFKGFDGIAPIMAKQMLVLSLKAYHSLGPEYHRKYLLQLKTHLQPFMVMRQVFQVLCSFRNGD